jgi:hypothetical protein
MSCSVPVQIALMPGQVTVMPTLRNTEGRAPIPAKSSPMRGQYASVGSPSVSL